jgi:riboflavin kinase/FMN adenylyltransferase
MASDKNRVISLGFFDGLHIGHSALMERALTIAEEKGFIPSVLTFDNHPTSMVTGNTVPLINSVEDRAGLIYRLFGIDDVIIVHFDMETMQMPWEDFVVGLVENFRAGHLVAGHDFRFGYRGQGNAERLIQKAHELGIECDIIPPVVYRGVTSSSTYIRTLIADGEIERANEFLGHPHVLTDTVRYGFRLGRELGTPTINMTFAPGVLIPAFGVYATRVYLEDGVARMGVTNIGIRPTVGDSDTVTAETHILDYRGNLYGRKVRIEFYKRLRAEMRFSNLDELKNQIHKDMLATREYFGNLVLIDKKK